MTVYVTNFFAPVNPKRPINFVVIKYFLLGLLISNSIESILIIPKILDVLDQTRIQTKELDEINIKKEELRELVAEKEREQKDLIKEEVREVKTIVHKTQEVLKEIKEEVDEAAKEEQFEKNQEKEHANGKNHRSRSKGKHEDHGEDEEYDEEHEGGKETEKPEHQGEKQHEKHQHQEVTVRKRPQRKETGANYVAVFMLFYGSVTLCLGLMSILKESALLLAGLIGVSVLGILTLISAGFSLIMLMSCSKDILIVLLTYKYRDMIVTSDSPLAAGVNAPGVGVDMTGNPYDPNAVQMPQQVSF